MSSAILLNSSQAQILQALAKSSEGMTRQQLVTKCPNAALTSDNVGVAGSDNHSGSLFKLGYITILEYRDDEGKNCMLFKPTAKGRKIGETIKTKSRMSEKVDVKKLDKIVISFRKMRTYGIESWTDNDIKEIKQLLNGEAEDVTIDDLRMQIANRRKQGAYADPTEKVKRQARATLAAFGPNGWVQSDLLSQSALTTFKQIAETGQIVAPDDNSEE